MKKKTAHHDLVRPVLKKADKCLPFMLALVLSASLWLNNAAFAGDAAISQTTDKRVDYQIEKITVTAQKQEENAQEIPASITVLDAVVIEDARINSVVDLGMYIPNFFIFEVANSNINTPSTRGIYAPMESGTVTTGLVVDGVPILSPIGYEAGLFDVEQVEFLRGPQGTLYGKGAEAGVINIVTRQPTNDFTGKISVDAGRWFSSEGDDWLGSASFYLSGPIVRDKLFFGVSGRYETKDGFILNTERNDPQYERVNGYGKANLKWVPTDKLEINFRASRMENRDDSSKQALSPSGMAMFSSYGLDIRELPSRLVAVNLGDEFYDITEDQQALKISYDLTDHLSLTSVTTNWRMKADALQDFDYTAYTLAHVKVDQDYKRTSQELRLNYARDRFKWLWGGYWDTDDSDTQRVTTSMLPTWAAHTHRIKSGDSYALFGNLTYPLTQKMSLTVGARYEAVDREFEDRLYDVKRDASWDDFSPKVSLEYSFTRNLMAYLSAAKGYRSGGFNELAESAEYYSYDPETLWSYELGIKSSFWDNRLILNGAVFYMDIKDMQATESLLSGMSHIINAEGGTSKGFELEARFQPAKGLTFMAGFGYTNAEFGNFSDDYGNYSGNHVPWSPEYTFNVGGQYRHSDGWYIRMDLIGFGKTYFDKTNNFAIDPYEIVNAKIGREFQHFDVYLYGKNIFDKNYDYIGVYQGSSTIFSEPGEIGMQLVYRF